MKKIEAIQIAPEKSKLIIEYIIKILSDNQIVNATMNFSFTKIDNQQMCVLNIYVPINNFERHINLEITSDHSLILYNQLLNDLLDTFLNHETIGISKYYSIHSMKGIFSGIDAVNSLGSNIKINFNYAGRDFMDLIANYTKRYNKFIEVINNQEGHLPKLK